MWLAAFWQWSLSFSLSPSSILSLYIYTWYIFISLCPSLSRSLSLFLPLSFPLSFFFFSHFLFLPPSLSTSLPHSPFLSLALDYPIASLPVCLCFPPSHPHSPSQTFYPTKLSLFSFSMRIIDYTIHLVVYFHNAFGVHTIGFLFISPNMPVTSPMLLIILCARHTFRCRGRPGGSSGRR